MPIPRTRTITRLATIRPFVLVLVLVLENPKSFEGFYETEIK
jgi:hypothetical protein